MQDTLAPHLVMRGRSNLPSDCALDKASAFKVLHSCHHWRCGVWDRAIFLSLQVPAGGASLKHGAERFDEIAAPLETRLLPTVTCQQSFCSGRSET